MDKIKHLLTTLIISATTVSCGLTDTSKPEGYVRNAVRKIDRCALYADTPEWKAKKAEVLATAKSLEEFDAAHELLREALKVAGGKHSAILAPVRDTASYPEIAPDARLLDGNITYIKLPAHIGVKVSDSLYTHTVLGFLLAHDDAAGVILDLRDNHGGNMYPMIAAVSPLIPDGIVLRFKSRKRTSPISLEFIEKFAHLDGSAIRKFPSSTPIAVLINDLTGSSGEATLLCFRGLENVRTFGIPTAGYASANQTFLLSDGYQMLVTSGCDIARTGEIFCDDPIAPDVTSETPLEDAIEWIRKAKQL
jgi:C-terminal processing protease CtpA/Prc